MTPIRIYFLNNEILIDTVPDALVAGSLTATLGSDGTVAITRIQSTYCIASLPWTSVADVNGNTFATPGDVMAYLTAQFAMRRPVGEVFGIPTVAGSALSQGQPVAVSRATGQLMLARSDTYVLSFVAGLAAADTALGFVVQPMHGVVTFADWTMVTGSVNLSVGLFYFLGASGGMTTTPIAAPSVCVTRVGFAASPTTMIVAPSDPITL